MRSNGSPAPLVGRPPFDADATLTKFRSSFEKNLATSLAMGQGINVTVADWMLIQLVQEQRNTNAYLLGIQTALRVMLSPDQREHYDAAVKALQPTPQKDAPNGHEAEK